MPVTEAESRVEALIREEVLPYLARNGERMNGIERQLDAMDRRMASMEASSERRITSMEANSERRTTAMEASLAAKPDTAYIDGRLNAMESNMATKADIARIDARFGAVESNMATKVDTGKLEERLDYLNGHIIKRDDFVAETTRLERRIELRPTTTFVIGTLISIVALVLTAIALAPYIRS